LEVQIYNKQNHLPIDSSWIKGIVQTVLEREGVACDEVIIHFVSKKKIADLHLQFFNDPSPTDCISFPMDQPHGSIPISLLGEIFVCPQIAHEYVKKNGGELRDEVALYIIHGLLHLLGYDDLTAKCRKIMRSKEKELLGGCL